MSFNRLICASSAVLMIFLYKPQAYAQDYADTLSISESVVTSLKTGGRLKDIPASVTVITSQKAKDLPSPTVADLFRGEAGISKGGDGIWETNIRIRGLGENRLVTLVNGNRVEVATDLTTSLSMFDVNDIERVEVIKGSHSSIYGTGAIGGVINVITKDGQFTDKPYFKGNAAASFSSVNNAHREYLSLYGGGKRWYLKLNGGFGQAGDVRTPSERLRNSGYNTADLGITSAFKPFDNHTFKIQFQRNDSWDTGIPGGAAFTPDAIASYRNAGRTLASVNYDIENLSPNLISLKFKTFYQGIKLEIDMDPNMATPQSGAMPTLVTPYAEHNTFGVSGESRWRFGSRNKLTAGLEMWRRSISSDREKYIDQYADGILAAQMIRREIPLPDASYTSAGFYAQDEFYGNRFVLTVGGRADLNVVRNGECHNVESVENVTAGTVISDPPGKYTTFEAGRRTDPSWSANAGMLFNATNSLDLTMNVSRSFRSPALEELFKFIDLAGNKIHFGNPELKAEKGLGAEMGARLHTAALEFHIDAYVNSLTDMIVERKTNISADSVNDTLMLDNTGKALLYGAEFSLSYQFAYYFRAYASGSLTVGKEAEGQWLPMIPPATLNVGLSYENSRFLGADLNLTAASRRPEGSIADGERPTEGWWRIDFSMHSRKYHFKSCELQLFGGIDNIFNAEYTNFLSTNRGNIICEPGRNIFLRLDVTF